MKVLVALTCFAVLLAPAPWGIALNHQTKECGGFWAGDEYGGHTLPEGWEDYYPNNQGIVETEIGSCSFDTTSGYEPPNERRAKAAEHCCQELGYNYVGGSIGKGRISPLMLLGLAVYAGPACAACCGISLLLVLVIGGVLVLRKRRRRRRAIESGDGGR